MQNYTAKSPKSEGGANSFDFDWQQKLIASFPIPNSANGQGDELANIEGVVLYYYQPGRREGIDGNENREEESGNDPPIMDWSPASSSFPHMAIFHKIAGKGKKREKHLWEEGKFFIIVHMYMAISHRLNHFHIFIFPFLLFRFPLLSA
jgi:hypothetical protein